MKLLDLLCLNNEVSQHSPGNKWVVWEFASGRSLAAVEDGYNQRDSDGRLTPPSLSSPARGALPRIKFKMVMMEKIDHLSGDKGMQHMNAGHQKLHKILVVSLTVGVGNRKKRSIFQETQKFASGHELETNRKIPRISLRLLHKSGTTFFLTALL